MNVYDFDHTIYAGDCTIDFWCYCLKKYPIILRTIPSVLLYYILFKLHLCQRETFKEQFYTFLKYVPDIHKEVASFWDKQINKVKSFYREQAETDDLVISASPNFLIDEACRRLRIRSISSMVNPFTGKLEGPNCRGKEKVQRYKVAYPDTPIERFYFDSASDMFLAKEAGESFLVTGETFRKVSIDPGNGGTERKVLSFSWTEYAVSFCKANQEALLYLLFGGLTFLISVFTFFLFYIQFGMNELAANLFSWVIAVSFAFITNKTWVFSSSTNTAANLAKQVVSFLGGRLVTLALEEIILFIFITMLKMPSVLIKMIAQAVVIFSNYAISKKIVFK